MIINVLIFAGSILAAYFIGAHEAHNYHRQKLRFKRQQMKLKRFGELPEDETIILSIYE